MAKPEEIDDLDALIDKAVDTFFVEAPTEDEETFFLGDSAGGPAEPEQPPAKPAPSVSGGPTLDEAMENLFSTSFQNAMASPPTTIITSGDDATDREIDLAVDTLFVEEPEAAPPETMELEVTAIEIPEPQPPQPQPRRAPVAAQHPVHAAPPAVEEEPDAKVDYDDVMAQEIERHMRTIYTGAVETPAAEAPRPAPPPPRREPEPPPRRHTPVQPSPPPPPVRPAVRPAPPAPVQFDKPRPPHPASPGAAHVVTETHPEPRAAAPALRKLQEAILTLEWEISKRSIAVLSSELKRVRIKYQDDVTVDFAVVAMKLVLDYLVQRMSRAHPESVRFLLEVTDLLDRGLGVNSKDPLGMFHKILTRYETFKSVVRKAEGFVDRTPPLLGDLEIADPQAFAKLVELQALMLIRAGRSLAKGIEKSRDPKNLIRSFRFLVNRSVTRILDSTRKRGESEKPELRKKSGRRTTTLQ